MPTLYDVPAMLTAWRVSRSPAEVLARLGLGSEHAPAVMAHAAMLGLTSLPAGGPPSPVTVLTAHPALEGKKYDDSDDNDDVLVDAEGETWGCSVESLVTR